MAIQLSVPTPTELRDGILRVTKNGLIARGIANPNVGEGSDHWVRATAIAMHLSPIYANQVTLVDAMMPDTAVGDELGRWLALFGDGFQPAAGSSGNIVFDSLSTGYTLVETGRQLLDETGGVFEVSVGGSYTNGDNIPTSAVSVGAITNHAAGELLQWMSPPLFAAKTATVGVGGLAGGHDKDDDESARARLLDHLRDPAAVGNPAHLLEWATKGSPAVNAPYVYPALDGPSTDGLCPLAALTFGSGAFTRALGAVPLAADEAYVNAQMPPRVQITTRTVTDVPADVSIALSLPDSVAIGGPGGGWIDAAPWPTLTGSATRVAVTTATSSTDITVAFNTGTLSTVGIVAGSTQIAWFSPAAWQIGQESIAAGQTPEPSVKTATILTATNLGAGLIELTLDKPLDGIATGDFVWPNAEHAEAYALTLIANFATLGPGQWTTSATRLPRALRRPYTSRSNPSDLGPAMLRAVTDSGIEVEDASWLYRSTSTPGVPSLTTDNPLVIVPRRIAFYPSV